MLDLFERIFFCILLGGASVTFVFTAINEVKKNNILEFKRQIYANKLYVRKCYKNPNNCVQCNFKCKED